MEYQRNVQTIACVGVGLVGSGWVAHFLRQGFDVVAYDRRAEAEDFLRRTVADAWPSLEKLGLKNGASKERLRFTTDLADAVAKADFVQESAFEDLEVKQTLMAAIDAICVPDVVIASSSAGFLAKELQEKCSHPERVLVGHPFNPPYLIPLVEIVGGEKASPAAVVWARDFYESIDCKAVVLRNEAIGYIGNRIQAAVYREVMHLVAEDVASVEDIDKAMVHGPGLRWALMGPFHVYYLGVQRPEQHHEFLEEIVREIQEGYVAPQGAEAVPGTIEKIDHGIRVATKGVDHPRLKAQRDQRLVGLRQFLRGSQLEIQD